MRTLLNSIQKKTPHTKIPKIGIICPNVNYDKDSKSYKAYINSAYSRYFRNHGEVLLIDVRSTVIHDLDLLVLPGGADISPITYSQLPLPECGYPNQEYEWFDKFIMPIYIENRTPIFGICRGAQRIAVEFGGSLHQHVPGLPKSTNGHFATQHNNEGSRSKVVEYLKTNNNYLFLDEVQNSYKGINSLHHQTINLINTNKVKSVAISNNFKNVEEILVEGENIFGIQYHIEELKNTKRIDFVINKLINKEVEKW